MTFLIGLLVCFAGGAIVYYSKLFNRRFGRWDYAEKYLGGTDSGFALVGFVLIVVGILIMAGLFTWVGGGVVKRNGL